MLEIGNREKDTGIERKTKKSSGSSSRVSSSLLGLPRIGRISYENPNEGILYHIPLRGERNLLNLVDKFNQIQGIKNYISKLPKNSGRTSPAQEAPSAGDDMTCAHEQLSVLLETPLKKFISSSQRAKMVCAITVYLDCGRKVNFGIKSETYEASTGRLYDEGVIERTIYPVKSTESNF